MKIGIIGVGNIGTIIAEALIDDHQLVLVNRRTEKLKRFQSKAQIFSKIEEMPDVDILFFCVKPQDATGALKRIKRSNERVIISTVTGLKMSTIKSYLEGDIVRIMPNIPISIGKGVVGLTYSEEFPEDKKQTVKSLLSNFGVLVEIEEKHFAAVTALSGSGPAFIFVIIEALVDAGMKLGLSYDTSMELVIETIKGSAELLQKEGKHPGEYRHLVTSPGGTTIEGIYSLEREGLRGILMKMIFDTYKKALELQGDSSES
ncbi:MAG: pyrroline-5-carboxylate reductase [Mesoaciditoga sp.]|uniref:pyrroline-5-carboxylate reductase n=1 Tax=Athalassotoga sp. TaxID=2022597 RepID=UPI000CB518BE|nr:MAG: pyrroline-5-carboxylate reductase [Mesoaciditoga sp.]PMP79556.1 MAG: pyrroline-5-carboxylate reductase [Mesoaciditoga sp.]HEU24813.1 pyrroline-5-carboxylate reductase [Mesoaciditoga lauensis]